MHTKGLLAFLFTALILIHFSKSTLWDDFLYLISGNSEDKLRKFFVGGDFQYVLNADGTPKNYSNFAYHNKLNWRQLGIDNNADLGKSPNGAVEYIFVDMCRNIYIGGAFTKVGDVVTGPIAKYNIVKRQWEAVGKGHTYSDGAKVNAIYADCANVPLWNNIFECSCDVYVGGKFNITYNGKTVRHIAKWGVYQDAWDLLDYNERYFTDADEVRTVYKKPAGLTEITKILWVGGTFDRYFKRYNLEFMGGIKGWLDVDNIGGPVNAIWFDRAFWLWDIDRIYVAGKFNRKCGPDSTETCKNIAYIYYRGGNRGWHSLVSNENAQYLPNGEINTIYKVGDKMYCAGNFVNDNYKYLGIIDTANKKMLSNSYVQKYITEPLVDIAVCSSEESLMGCKEGSILVAGQNGLLGFHDMGEDYPNGVFKLWGNGTRSIVNGTEVKGEIHSIAYAYMVAAAVKPSTFLGISVLLLSIFLLL